VHGLLLLLLFHHYQQQHNNICCFSATYLATSSHRKQICRFQPPETRSCVAWRAFTDDDQRVATDIFRRLRGSLLGVTQGWLQQAILMQL